jgi:proline iminopeptidase
MSSSPLRSLYPDIEPFDSGFLPVSPLHTLYYEQSGNPHGKPVVFLHGGPGGGTTPKCRRFFDPALYRIVLFDQRGCGQSTPHAELSGNTTWDLVADIERLREHLGIERWQVFGGSWGSTLALAYAQTHPDKVTELVLRGIFMLRRDELEWFYQKGCSTLYPDAWEAYLAAIPEVERGDLMSAYHRRLTSSDAKTRTDAARAWSVWEGATSFLWQDQSHIQSSGEDEFALAFARIECHYFVNGGFFPEDGWILKSARKLKPIPGWIVQGRFDVVTPLDAAWRLKTVWPEANFEIVWDAGHASTEPGIIDALVRAGDEALARS